MRDRENGTGDPLGEKSFAFALRIVRLYRHLQEEYREFVLSRQLLRSGTAIGALIREAKYAQSKPDLLHKLSIALKEANETKYWLELLRQSDYLDERSYQSIEPEIEELLRLLIASTKTLKGIQ
jgi:four helix bundle protein